MSVKEEKNNKPLKMAVLVVGGFLIAASITPYINSYLLSDRTTSVTEQHNSENTLEETFSEDKTTTAKQLEANLYKAEVVKNTEKQQQLIKSNAVKPYLPELHESDIFLLKQIKPNTTKSLFVPLDIIRNMVVFVDNFSRGELVTNFSPLQKPLAPFSVTEQQGIIVINSKSYQRYDRYANAIDALDTDKFIALYKKISPLIDEAYQEIGYPAGSFNQTFDLAIDHVFATPIIQYKLEVDSTSVMYKFVDQHLEALPDTQKLMLRMGPENLKTIQKKLLAIQDELQRL